MLPFPIEKENVLIKVIVGALLIFGAAWLMVRVQAGSEEHSGGLSRDSGKQTGESVSDHDAGAEKGNLGVSESTGDS